MRLILQTLPIVQKKMLDRTRYILGTVIVENKNKMHKTKNSEKTTKNGTNKPKNKEEDEVGKKLSAYNKEFKRLVKLVEN